MTDVPPPGSTPQAHPFFDGIAADYRKKVDDLFVAHIESRTWVKAISLTQKVALAVLGGLGLWLWTRFVHLDATVASAKNDIAAAASGFLIPIGTVIAWPGERPKPETDEKGNIREPKAGDWNYHWRVCDGSEVDLLQHASLNAAIGSTYGKAENGKVKLPDFRGMFLRGAGKVVQPIAHDRLLPVYSPKPIGEQQLSSVSPLDMLFSDAGISNGAWLYPRLDGSVNGPRDEKRNYVDVVLHSAKQMGVPAGATETVPINYAVHWIIRVR